MDSSSTKEVATLAGGCFWCLEAVFERLQGVERVDSGYIGGHVSDPTYEQVCTGTTGHAEAVLVTFDPQTISYQKLLDIFFAFHDPTTLNRQGPDTGTQYRSAIFYHSPEQEAIAKETVVRLTVSRILKDPIVTEIVPAPTFYPAEEYHREFYRRNQDQPYCQFVIEPKMTKLRREYISRLKG